MSPSASRRSCAAGRPAAVEPASVFSFSSRRTPSLARSSRTKLFWASAAVAQRRAAATAAARAKVLSIWCSSWAFRPWVSAAGRACDAAAHGQEPIIRLRRRKRGETRFDAGGLSQSRAEDPAMRTTRPALAAALFAAEARAALQTAAKKLRDDAKFAVLADAKTGIAIGVPQAVLPKRDVNPNGGS